MNKKEVVEEVRKQLPILNFDYLKIHQKGWKRIKKDDEIIRSYMNEVLDNILDSNVQEINNIHCLDEAMLNGSSNWLEYSFSQIKKMDDDFLFLLKLQANYLELSSALVKKLVDYYLIYNR